MKNNKQLFFILSVTFNSQVIKKASVFIFSFFLCLLFLSPNKINAQLTWIPYTGTVPSNAVTGGFENGKNMFVVRAASPAPNSNNGTSNIMADKEPEYPEELKNVDEKYKAKLELFPGSEYKIHLFTGSVTDAGTDASITLALKGEKGEIKGFVLNHLLDGNAFEKGAEDILTVIKKDIGKITSIEVSSDNAGGSGSGWFLDKVKIKKDNGSYETFPCECWLEGDKLTETLTPKPLKKYEFQARTTNKVDAGTDATVFLSLIGEKGTIDKIRLTSYVDGNAWERAELTKGEFKAKDIGNITQAKIWTDNAGSGSDWDLDYITVTQGKEYYFPCNCNFTTGDNTKTLNATEGQKYKVKVVTGNVTDAGTDANVTISIIGDKGSIENMTLNQMLDGNAFEKGDIDQVEFYDKDIGKMQTVKVSHDNTETGPGWFLRYIEVEQGNSKKKFECECWLIGEASENVQTLSTKPLKDYKISFKTQDETDAGTDASISIKIYGEDGELNFSPVNHLLDGNAFERGDLDMIKVKGQDIGKITSIEVSSDNSGGSGSGWKLGYVITEVNSKESFFDCGCWFDGDNLSRTITAGPPPIDYEVKIKTADIVDAGTDSYVSIIIYGDKGETKELFLNGEISGNAFERNDLDLVKFKGTDVGNVQKIKISKSNEGLSGEDWRLEYVEVERKGKPYFFYTDSWFEKGSLTKVLKETGKPVKYKITIRTPDIAEAGTDANNYITIIGDKGSTSEVQMNGYISGNAFEQGDVDKLTIEGLDVGNIQSVIIRTDNTHTSPDWRVHFVAVEKDGKEYFFNFNNYEFTSASSKTVQAGNALVKYTVKIKTGNDGTDANIYVQINGDKGSTSKERLNGHISGNAFEQGDTDVVTFDYLEDVGKVTSVTVWNDQTETYPDWQLDSISITKGGKVYQSSGGQFFNSTAPRTISLK